jgi:succinylglutamate desuccinylase
VEPVDEPQLRVLTDLPPGFLDAPPTALRELLGGPTLINLPGLRDRPLFVSVLQHGNETSGLAAVQALLRPYLGRPLPRALSLFIANVTAAEQGVRLLDGQPDYNRVWPGGRDTDCPEGRLMAQVTDHMRQRRVFASIDVHNNTGHNPHYACICRLEGRHLHLASLFARAAVYFTHPRGVQTQAFADLCPAVTLECGPPTEALGAEHAREFIHAVLHLREIPEHASQTDMAVYHTIGRVRVPEGVSFAFGGAGADLELLDDLQHLNFRELPVGTVLARVPAGGAGRLLVDGNDGNDAAPSFLEQLDGEIRTIRAVTPSMFTHDARVIRQDCLGYLMERLELPGSLAM